MNRNAGSSDRKGGQGRKASARTFNKTKPQQSESEFGGVARKKSTTSKPRFSKPMAEKPAPQPTDGIRLNRYIANGGICSRRDADTYIQSGMVTVNGKVVTELGVKVGKFDEVKFDGKVLMPEKKVYILLNKPKGYVTTLEDPHADRTVMDLISKAGSERVYPVGRLDKATTGLLLLTNDGDIADKLSHPKNNKKKIYQVTLDRNAKTEDLQLLYNGIELEDGFVKADKVSFCNMEDKSEIGIEIHSGRNRVVRRMFEHVGYKVKKLDRVYYAGLTKKNLPRGKWRFLDDKEIIMLQRGTYV